MPCVIEFASREDRLRAIDILFDEDESYSGVPPSRFLVTKKAVQLLRAQGVQFRVWGEPGKIPEP